MLYKFVGNRILTFLENRALNLDLTEFHSGYRAYSLRALAAIAFSAMTDDFRFDGLWMSVRDILRGLRVRVVRPLPRWLRYALAWDHGLCRAVLAV